MLDAPRVTMSTVEGGIGWEGIKFPDIYEPVSRLLGNNATGSLLPIKDKIHGKNPFPLRKEKQVWDPMNWWRCFLSFQ